MGLLHTIARSQEQLVAVHVAPTMIGIAVVDDSRRQPKVSAFDFEVLDHDPTNPRSFLDQPQWAAETLRDILRRNRIRRRDASISVPTREVVIRKSQIPLMSEAEFHSAAEIGGLWDAFAWMPAASEDYFVDFDSFNRDTESGMMTACMVAAPLSVVSRYTGILSLAGLTTVMIDTDNFAIWRALNRWLSLEGEERSNAICEVVTSGDYVTVLREGIPELTELFGMEQLRQKLISAIELADEEQQQLFDSYGSQIAGVIGSAALALQQADGEWGRSEERPEEERSTVLLLSDLPALEQYRPAIAASFSVHGLELADIQQTFSRPAVVEAQFRAQAQQAPLLVTLGLGLRRLEVFGGRSGTAWGTRAINLLPGHQRLKSVRKRRFLINFWSALVGIPLLALLVFLQAEQSRQQLQLSEQMVRHDRLQRSIVQLEQSISQQQIDLKPMVELLEVARGVGNNYQMTYTLLSTLVRRIPLGIRLDSVEWSESGLLQVHGVAENDELILSLIERLRAEAVLSRVSLATIAEESLQGGRESARYGGGERQFLIECEVAGGSEGEGADGN